MGVGPSLTNDIKEIKDLIAAGLTAAVTTAKAGDTGTIKAGNYTCDGDDDTAGSVAIATGLSSITSFQLSIYRSNVQIFLDQVISISGGTITLADGAANYAITSGDVLRWTAVGAL